MPARTDPLIRVSRATYQALKLVKERCPEYGISMLADLLLAEVCGNIMGRSAPALALATYLHSRCGKIVDMDDESVLRAAEDVPGKSSVPTVVGKSVRYGKQK